MDAEEDEEENAKEDPAIAKTINANTNEVQTLLPFWINLEQCHSS